MDLHRIIGCRPIGVAAAAALAVGMATTGSAAATPYAGSASVSSDTLTVIGTRQADQIALRLAAGDPTTLQVDFGDDGTADRELRVATPSAACSCSSAAGATGSASTRPTGTFADEALTVVRRQRRRHRRTAATATSSCWVAAATTPSTAIAASTPRVFGSGEDSFTWDPGDGSDLIHGGSWLRHARLQRLERSDEVMSLSANGSSSVFLRDGANIRMDMTGVEVLDLAALGGADSIDHRTT